MRKLAVFSLIVAFAVIIGCSKETPMDVQSPMNDSSEPMGHASDAVATYEIVIENLTPNNGNGAAQPFSPPVVATHHSTFHIYKEGRFASFEVQRVAEDAQNDPLVSTLSSSPCVFDYNVGGGVILPGQSAKIMVEAKVGFRQLSLISMLVNTNDGFIGLDGLRLPGLMEEGMVMEYVTALDAGTEKNTEMTDHIPGPCCGNPGVRVPEHKRIDDHDGILGVGDLDPAIWGWSEPAAKITVKLVGISS